MDRPYMVYKSNFDKEIDYGACPDDSDLAMYLHAEILKFNFKFKTNIGFYSDEILEGEILRQARKIIYLELQYLLDNYHVDADPNGFGRKALKVTILGQERVLNHAHSKIDQIIYELNGMLQFFDETIARNGRVEIYGLGGCDVIDWNIVWKVNRILKTEGSCTLENHQKQLDYLFKNELLQFTIDEFKERLDRLVKNNYLIIKGNRVETTEKGKVVGVWANYITRKITINK